MPKRNVYIRDKNISKWDGLPSQADWVNQRLEEPTTNEREDFMSEDEKPKKRFEPDYRI